MGKTEKLYYLEPTLDSVAARILSVRSLPDSLPARVEIVLDRTIFYPEGGGQPCDLGTIGGRNLIEVREGPEGPIHILSLDPSTSAALWAAGTEVELILDRKRRRDHSQQHSGQHLLSAVLEREWGIHTLSFHLGEAYSTIDVTAPSIDRSLTEAIESKMDKFIAEEAEYRVHLSDSVRAQDFPLRKRPPEGEEELRIVEIAGYDWVACCGTHVSRAGELRLVKILSSEKYKGNTRIYFAAGDRAVSLLSRTRDAFARTAGVFGCSIDEVEERAKTLVELRKLQDLRIRTLTARRAELEVEAALASGSASGVASGAASGRRGSPLGFEYGDRGADEALDTLKAASNRGFSAIVLTKTDATVCVQISAADASGRGNLASILRPLSLELGGRGGGGSTSFRTVLPDAEKAAVFFQSALKALTD